MNIKKILTADLESKYLIYLKALLFIILLATSILLNLTTPNIKLQIISILLIIWSSARIYYFMFYVIEKYIDDKFRFSSVYDFVRYLLQ